MFTIQCCCDLLRCFVWARHSFPTAAHPLVLLTYLPACIHSSALSDYLPFRPHSFIHPVCTSNPARSSIMSGRYFWQTGLGAIEQGRGGAEGGGGLSCSPTEPIQKNAPTPTHDLVFFFLSHAFLSSFLPSLDQARNGIRVFLHFLSFWKRMDIFLGGPSDPPSPPPSPPLNPPLPLLPSIVCLAGSLLPFPRPSTCPSLCLLFFSLSPPYKNRYTYEGDEGKTKARCGGERTAFHSAGKVCFSKRASTFICNICSK